MSAPNYNDDPQYAGTRLNSSVVLYKKMPLLVHEVLSDGIVHGALTETCIAKEVLLGELDLTPVKLGMVNHNNKTSFCFRNPVRYWKQGLTKRTLSIVGDFVSYSSVPLARTILKRYLKPEDCYDLVINGEAISQGFSRDFCIGNFITNERPNYKGIPLMYRTKQVGYVENTMDSFLLYKLDDKFKFLEQALKGDVNHVG